MSEDPDFKAVDASIKHHQATEAAEGWIKYVSLSMIFLAVLAAYASQRASVLASSVMKNLNEATFNQAQASDQWSLYQAKSIKQSMAENTLVILGAGSIDAAGKRDLEAKVSRYGTETAQVMKEARDLEAKRDQARARAESASIQSGRMSVDSTLFQAAIAVGGVCLTVKKRWAWFVSLALGFVGLAVLIWLSLSV